MKGTSRKMRVDRDRAEEYGRIARSFLDAARMAAEFDYANASGLLSIHFAIAYGDAVTIRQLGERAAGESHEQSADLVERAAPRGPESTEALKHYRRLINEKNRMAHTGETCTMKEAKSLLSHAERFAAWAVRVAGIE